MDISTNSINARIRATYLISIFYNFDRIKHRATGGEKRMRAQEAVVKRINGLCKRNQISVNHLATLAGMNPSTLKNIVYGITRNTGIETVEKICIGLNMSLADFFEDETFHRLDLEVD